MTDGSTSRQPRLEDPPPPPPPGGPAPRIPLRRSATDRVVAGVAGGIARHFGIDPVIIRLGFVVLALLGGSGVLLYLIAWLVIPREGEEESAAMEALRGGARPGGRSLVAITLLVGAILLLSGSIVWWPTFGVGDGLFLPLLILAAGVALLVWPNEGYEWHRNPDAGDDDGWRRERAALREEWRRERDAWRASRRAWRHGYRRGFSTHTTADSSSPTPSPPPADAPPAPPPPSRVPRPPRPRPFLGPLAVALLLLYTGVAVFAERVGWVAADLGLYLAGFLVVIGGVLVVSAFVGRARGLIWLGVFVLPVAWFFSTVDLQWWNGIGQRDVAVADLHDLDDEYRWGIGEYRVDLSDLDLGGESRTVQIGLTIGELVIHVPPRLATEVDVEGGIGEIIVRDATGPVGEEGVGLRLDRTVGDPSGGTLELEVDLGIGRAEVVVCGDGGPPCP